MRPALSPPKPIVADGHSGLRDFRTNSRMLVLVGLAIPVGVVSALMAKLLLWLIAEITNLVFFQRFGTRSPSAGESSSRPVDHRSAGGGRTHHRIDGALRLGKDSRSWNSGSARSDSSRRQHGRAEGGAAEADFVGHLHRHRRTVRRGRADHHDGRGVRLDYRAVFSSHRRRTKDTARRGRGRRDGGGLFRADRRDTAGGGTTAFRMAAAQLHSRRRGRGGGEPLARAVDRRRPDLSHSSACGARDRQ